MAGPTTSSQTLQIWASSGLNGRVSSRRIPATISFRGVKGGYGKTIEIVGQVSTMIERDDNIPPLEDLLKELDEAKKIAETALLTEVTV